MIRYRYQSQVQPPAPFVAITLVNPINGNEVSDVPAQIDTAADRSVVPERLVESLHLPRIGELTIGGIGGVKLTLTTYPIQIRLHDFPERHLEIMASAGEDWVLLGRDWLNSHRTTLDGPQSVLEIA